MVHFVDGFFAHEQSIDTHAYSHLQTNTHTWTRMHIIQNSRQLQLPPLCSIAGDTVLLNCIGCLHE